MGREQLFGISFIKLATTNYILEYFKAQVFITDIYPIYAKEVSQWPSHSPLKNKSITMTITWFQMSTFDSKLPLLPWPCGQPGQHHLPVEPQSPRAQWPSTSRQAALSRRGTAGPKQELQLLGNKQWSIQISPLIWLDFFKPGRLAGKHSSRIFCEQDAGFSEFRNFFRST